MQDPLTLIHGDALSSLRTLESESVQTSVTSPPYWGLRSYGTEPVVWDVGECAHEWASKDWYRNGGGRAEGGNFTEAGEANAENIKASRWMVDSTCSSCGAWRGELGLEPTPDLYVQHLVEIFREVRRVLRNDGTLWLNIGDSYATGGGAVGRCPGGGDQGERFLRAGMINTQPNRMPIPGLKPKDLVGIPWMVAFALRADGWYLRSEVTWCKRAPMPESVVDRPTSASEKIFLLSKSQGIRQRELKSQ
jgi:DNA modification methylase